MGEKTNVIEALKAKMQAEAEAERQREQAENARLRQEMEQRGRQAIQRVLGAELAEALGAEVVIRAGDEAWEVPVIRLHYRERWQEFAPDDVARRDYLHAGLGRIGVLMERAVAGWLKAVDRDIEAMEQRIAADQARRAAMIESVLEELRNAARQIDEGNLRDTRIASAWARIKDYHLDEDERVADAFAQTEAALASAVERWIAEFIAGLESVVIDPTEDSLRAAEDTLAKAQETLEEMYFSVWNFPSHTNDPRLKSALDAFQQRIDEADVERGRRLQAEQAKVAVAFRYYRLHYGVIAGDGQTVIVEQVSALHAHPDDKGWWLIVDGKGQRKVRLPYVARIERIEVSRADWLDGEIPWWLPLKETPYGTISVPCEELERLDSEEGEKGFPFVAEAG